jgi:hypothetical protein
MDALIDDPAPVVDFDHFCENMKNIVIAIGMGSRIKTQNRKAYISNFFVSLQAMRGFLGKP